ncbi:MAG TPA: hypothetical protein VMU54_13720 [Planctomycetota bacterium]|nr:hypothetical protein [Planctomycetota bacterium]
MRKAGSFSVLMSGILGLVGLGMASGVDQRSLHPQAVWIAIVGILPAVILNSAVNVASRWEQVIVSGLGHLHSIRVRGLFVPGMRGTATLKKAREANGTSEKNERLPERAKARISRRWAGRGS